MVESTRQRTLRNAGIVMGVAALLAWSLFPIYWIVNTSFKTDREIYAFPPTFLPDVPTLRQYVAILFESQFPAFIANSLLVAVSVTMLSVVISVLAAYPIARWRFAGRSTMARLIVVAYLLPPSLLFIPLFVVLRNLGLVDTLAGLTLAYLTFTVPFCTWMLIGSFRAVPAELDEAAAIDGATRLQSLLRVLLPITLPGIAVVCLFAFTHAWNEFLYALVFVYGAASQTFTAGLSGLVMGDTFIWGQLMAASVVAILPIAVIYLIAQKYLIEGLAAGSVK